MAAEDPTAVRVAPDNFRSRVIAVLADTDPAGRGRVTVEEVQSGLSAASADALVYLVAGTVRLPGYALVVPAAGPVAVLTRPDLRIDGTTPVGGYASAALRSRDLSAAGLTADLDDVGDWAWRVAMGEIVARTKAWGLGRPAHLVLVPMGDLALVPWHAAHTEVDGVRRYAVADIAFSYSPSARMLCSAVSRDAVANQAALVVGDPRGDLHFAGLEAEAIRTAFYPHGTFLGTGNATATRVRDWIARHATGASILHLACHGRVEPGRPAGASLVLADGPLAALDLVEATRLGAFAVDQVFLAACTTSDVGRAYDEAFSLASSFLAAGARTVFGSMWAVPDAETSLLMFMVHHYLVAEGRSPADSLHAAQLWMLDPDRKAPATMPPALALHSGRPDAADPIAWAAFTHLGR